MRTNDWSRVRLFEEVGAELGYSAKSRSAMLPLLIEKEPTPDQAVVLARHFGEPPAQPEREPVAEEPSLAAALMAQAKAIEALTQELRLARLQQVEESAVVLRALGSLGANLDPPRRPVPDGHESVPGNPG